MIHIFSQNGYTLALDVYSGAVHLVDEEAAELIRLFEHHSKEDTLAQYLSAHPEADKGQIQAGLVQIEALESAGKLYTKDSAVKKALASDKKSAQLKALCLNVAHSCNLTCSYCFASQGRYKGEQALMSYETGKQALDYLIAHSGSRRNLEVDFFGGEPLLNWYTVKRLVSYGRSKEEQAGKRFRFTLTTNGMLLDDEVMAFCNQEMHNVVLSLDGRQAVHDRFRVDHQGRGSYERVVPRFLAFAASRKQKNYYVRGTFTRYNLDFLQDILHMADLGFTQLSMEPMVGDPRDPASLREEDLPILYEQYEQLAIHMLERYRLGRGFDFYHYLIDLEAGPCLYKRLSGCGSGTEYLAVTPAGELYPCHQFVGDPQHLLGTVWDGILHPERQMAFSACTLDSRLECRDCWAKLYCAGGCAANAYHATGSIQGVYAFGCKLFKKRLESALMLQAAQAQDKQQA